ncbi:hypothetical protein H9Q73_012993 [Fusarium xylarioides]|nr:hypothetical protein H9Q73_012993 [Fusarium xylarioides]
MVAEAFKTAGVNKVDALLRFHKCVERLIRGKPFSESTIDEYKDRKSVRNLHLFDMSQWLPLAIKFYLRLRADVFVIQHDGGLSSPQIEKKTFMNKKDWFVRINTAPGGSHQVTRTADEWERRHVGS